MITNGAEVVADVDGHAITWDVKLVTALIADSHDGLFTHNFGTGGTSAAVPQGGATAGGFGPTARIATVTGGADGAGNAPTPRALTVIGGADGAGNSPTPRTTTIIGGADAAGNTPTTKIPTVIGGANAAGTSPGTAVTPGQGGGTGQGQGAVARVDVVAGGGVAGGVGPTDGTGVSDAAPQGGAIAAGNAPTARILSVIGGGVGAGASPSTSVGVSIGAAVAAGVVIPGVKVLVAQGGAAAGGFRIVDGSDLLVPDRDLNLRVIAVFHRMHPIARESRLVSDVSPARIAPSVEAPRIVTRARKARVRSLV